MFRSIGAQELLILGVIFVLLWIPALGFYRIAKRAGFSGGASFLWALGFLFFSWITPVIMGFIEWPRDRAGFPPPPPATMTHDA